jgi:hypothetical protein
MGLAIGFSFVLASARQGIPAAKRWMSVRIFGLEQHDGVTAQLERLSDLSVISDRALGYANDMLATVVDKLARMIRRSPLLALGISILIGYVIGAVMYRQLDDR